MLNMRENPSTSTKIIDQIPNGTKVDIIETSNGWYKFRTMQDRMVYGSYVKVTETPKLTVTDETILATLNKGSTGNSSTNSSTNNSAVNNSSSQVVDETIQKPAQNAASGENTENTVVKQEL